MYTEQRLFAYLQQFERDFAGSSARIIDATEGGAMKRGAEVMSLSEVLQELSPIENDAIIQKHGHSRRAGTAHATHSLEQRLEEGKQIEAIARETLPLLEEVSTCLDDQPRVNRLIATIDTLRARMLRFNDCYELITALSQQSELDRFRHDRQLTASRLSGLERQKKQLERDIANVRSLLAGSGAFATLIEETIAKMGSEA